MTILALLVRLRICCIPCRGIRLSTHQKGCPVYDSKLHQGYFTLRVQGIVFIVSSYLNLFLQLSIKRFFFLAHGLIKYDTDLFDLQMGPQQLLLPLVEVNLGVMATKGHSTQPRVPRLNPHHLMQFSIIHRTSHTNGEILYHQHLIENQEIIIIEVSRIKSSKLNYY